MAIVLGAANAYLGLKAGLTISATFPAAVVAIAAFRLPFFRGNVLEQNIARTAASVGEALVAGAIFTLPAFLIARVGGEPLWEEFDYWSSTWIMLVGGVLGVLFVILLRRTLVEDAELPFPESAACAELVKAGQKGESGARYVFGAIGIAALLEMFKNSRGIEIIAGYKEWFFKFPRSLVTHGAPEAPLGRVAHEGGAFLATPAASPALIAAPSAGSFWYPCSCSSIPIWRPAPVVRTASSWRTRSGAITCGRLRWARCWSARSIPCSDCVDRWRRHSAAWWQISGRSR